MIQINIGKDNVRGYLSNYTVNTVVAEFEFMSGMKIRIENPDRDSVEETYAGKMFKSLVNVIRSCAVLKTKDVIIDFNVGKLNITDLSDKSNQLAQEQLISADRVKRTGFTQDPEPRINIDIQKPVKSEQIQEPIKTDAELKFEERIAADDLK